jgi:phenylalanyl-tRNA synthetase alpha chain
MNAEQNKGTLHPTTQFIREVVGIFESIGFAVAAGPELEIEHYNFDALNIPADHTSRDMQDTFWVKGTNAAVTEAGKSARPVLRTHTSPVQARYMEAHKNQLPIAIIVPGKTFRNEATDVTHEAQFFQLEGLYVDKNVSMAHLKGTMEFFLKKLYGEKVQVRFRPSYFPFVEPGVEVDLYFDGRWIEVAGAGMVHPNVLRAAGIDPTVWSGFAFGCGIDRLVMRQHALGDVRSLWTGDLRFLNQFI